MWDLNDSPNHRRQDPNVYFSENNTYVDVHDDVDKRARLISEDGGEGVGNFDEDLLALSFDLHTAEEVDLTFCKMLQGIDRPSNGNFPPTVAANLPRQWCLEEEPSFRKILDPQGPFLQRWNCIFFLSCLFSALVDPLFLYISVFNEKKTCLDLDNKLGIAATVLRSVTDVFYMLHIILQFRTGFMGPSSSACGRGVLVGDPSEIAKRYMTSYFLIDILAVLPLPQVVILLLIPKLRGPPPLHAIKLLRFVLFQYILRFIQIIRLYREDRRSYGILTRNAWSGAALTLYFYMLASHDNAFLREEIVLVVNLKCCTNCLGMLKDDYPKAFESSIYYTGTWSCLVSFCSRSEVYVLSNCLFV
ncbi:K+-channel ERG [Cinnamomum micranthum f. kanehirae]|uniref:K+-channel ERG n=1 Tax=Cinnamomum micranthum f. kanehirae TaxID=337451 RepID=A0A3S3PRU0_9MAGN|nr:K+-channel ERG [Cinnamomum micranthum f. kanehirae]